MHDAIFSGLSSPQRIIRKEGVCRAGQEEVLFYINRSETARTLQAIHINYDGASDHNSEDRLPPTKDRKGISPPRSVPSTVRRANLMPDGRPALHTIPGALAVFFKDSIKRAIISGMMLPGITLAGDGGRLGTTRKAHIATQLWVRSRSVRFASPAIF